VLLPSITLSLKVDALLSRVPAIIITADEEECRRIEGVKASLVVVAVAHNRRKNRAAFMGATFLWKVEKALEFVRVFQRKKNAEKGKFEK
jgi:hypothetical protein